MARKLKGFASTMCAVDSLSEFCKRMTLSPEVFPEGVRLAVFAEIHAAINTLTADTSKKRPSAGRENSA